MTDMPYSPRFALPLLAVAQAQKEMTHNEALTLLDAIVQATVEDGPLDTPATSPAPGQCWLVGAAPTGAWSGRAQALAVSTVGGWRFVTPREGMRAVRQSDGGWLVFRDGDWREPATVPPPSGGGVVDGEARAAIAAVILALGAHGLLISG